MREVIAALDPGRHVVIAGPTASGKSALALAIAQAQGGVVVNASVNPDGTFAAETQRTTGTGAVSQPGAPAGRYKVIFHPPSDGSETGLESHIAEMVTVGAGVNTAVIVLPSAVPKDQAEPRNGDNPPAK